MDTYLTMLDHLLTNGKKREDRTGTGTIGVFGYQNRYSLRDGTYPLLTTKKLHTRSIFGELLWLLRGDTNIRWMQDRRVTIWDEWADENGDLGPVYGQQWRGWGADETGVWIDQIASVIYSLKRNPYSRRHIVNAWDVAKVPGMALPPCHMLFQFHVEPADDGGAPYLNCELYQRSADIFLGVPFNIASYASLMILIANIVGYRPGDFVHTFGDLHLYSNHIDQAHEQLSRDPRPLPTLTINMDAPPLSVDDLSSEENEEGMWVDHDLVFRHSPSPKVDRTRDFIPDLDISDFVVEGYDPHPVIKAPVAV